MSEYTIKETISKNITKYREAANLSQKEFAKRLGVVPSRVSNWENGANCPTIDILFKVCEVLGVSINDIYGIYPDSKIRLTYDEIEHIKKFRNLDSVGKEVVSYILDREAKRGELIDSLESQISDLKSRPVTLVDFYTLKPDSTRITEYFRSASAGDGIFILGNEVKARAIIPESSWIENTDYVIGVSGDSMKPDFEDGDNVMVSQHVPLHHGDVGIFVVNGNVYIKEYGETELISRNPDFPNIKISEYDNIVCMGKVLGKLKGDYKIVNE